MVSAKDEYMSLALEKSPKGIAPKWVSLTCIANIILVPYSKIVVHSVLIMCFETI